MINCVQGIAINCVQGIAINCVQGIDYDKLCSGNLL